MREPALSGTLSFLLPDAAGAALLVACLRPGRAAAAWRAFERMGGDLDSHRALLPLLDEGVRLAGVELPRATADRLRGARLHESLRLAEIRAIAAEALDSLAALDLDPVVVQDVALAHTAYSDPALRHCHALDLLVPPAAARAAGEALTRAGFSPRLPLQDPARSLAHRSGFSVRVDERPVPVPATGGDAIGIGARAREIRLGDRTARVAAAEDALAIACGRAAVRAARGDLLWACDATRLVESSDSLDWDRVVDAAGDQGLELALAAMLGWLADALAVAVPGDVVETLERRARGRPVEPILDCVRADGRARTWSLLRAASNWREQWTVLRWTAFPSAARLRRSYPGLHPVVAWLVRPLRGAVRLLTRSGRRSPAHGSRDREAGRGAARSGGPSAPAEDPPFASRRSSA